jgi:hypothetical protein
VALSLVCVLRSVSRGVARVAVLIAWCVTSGALTITIVVVIALVVAALSAAELDI